MKHFILDDALRPHIKKIKPYSSARHEFTGDAGVFLDANENPYPATFNRYPDPDQTLLKKIISDVKHVPVENIFLGNGSDEAIDLLMRAFCEPGKDEIITLPPTYGMYRVSASINNIFNKEIFLNPDFTLPAEKVLQANNEKTKIIFLCSPNNPTGNSFNPEEIQKIISESGKLVVIDEAYIDFSNQQSLNALYNTPNLVVLQTLSKAYGLAGLRIGIATGPLEIIKVLNSIKPPYNISASSVQAAVETLKNAAYLKNQCLEIISERKNLETELKTFNFIKRIFISDANFILVRVEEARDCYNYLKEQGIIIRDRSSEMHCEGCLRITVGTPEENIRLLQTLKKFEKLKS